MKFIFALVFLAVAVSAAPAAPENPARALAESLEKRGTALVEGTHKVLSELFHSGHYHLASGLEHQLTLVEALVLDLKVQLANKDFIHHLHHIHVIEEDLMHLENRISEELFFIREAQNHHHQGHNHDGLVAKGEALVKQAKEVLAKHPHGREARSLEKEIADIEKLITAIRAKPAASDLKNDEQQLARHEKTLAALIEKANHRGGHHGF